MNRLLCSIFILIICFGCATQNKKDKKKRNRLALAIKSAEKSQIKTDTILLGFRFGMTQSEVNKHIENLTLSKRLYVGNGGYYTYDFQTKTGTIQSILYTKYHNDQLYIFALIFQRMDSIIDSKTLMDQANDVCKIKFKNEGFKSYAIEDSLENVETMYIKDNLIVELSSKTSRARMSYINAPIVQLINQENESED